jgi:CRISPR-associated endonuclease/helicase Cas3
MGGEDATDWRLYPEETAILVGTQDMLLSRALNRGFVAGRARWPMEYALLNNDCLWVLDEVQLMDVGLITSAQLQAFRNIHEQCESLVPGCRTWWMSATLRPDWFESVDFHNHLEELEKNIFTISAAERNEVLWTIKKSLEIRSIPSPKGKAGMLADTIFDVHKESVGDRFGKITLAVFNTVDAANEIYKRLSILLDKEKSTTEIELVHSRFRGSEREQWPKRFLARRHCSENADRIIISTQVVEAGVDISATNLVTELAPWACLVQRFGRCARYGGQGRILVIDRELGDKVLPYQPGELVAAKEALQLLEGKADIKTLTSLEESLEQEDPHLLSRLFPYEYIHLLTQREADELFDTSPDLTGADLDISRFIRAGDERDLSVFWIDDLTENVPPPAGIQPTKNSLCPVPVHMMRDWLKEIPANRAWRWDYLEGQWIPLRLDDISPGLTICVESKTGGYSLQRGWTGGKSSAKDDSVPVVPVIQGTTADISQDDEGDSRKDYWRTIATHGREVAEELEAVIETLGCDLARIRPVFDLAAWLHDWGKAHPVFLSCMQEVPEAWAALGLAKAPSWVAPREFFTRSKEHGRRRGFRHELVSALACFELLRGIEPYHSALLGPYKEYVELGILDELEHSELPEEYKQRLSFIARLSQQEFNLLVYLVCSHHGKIRGTIQSSPHDQEFPVFDTRLSGIGQPIRGVREEDILPACTLEDNDHNLMTMPKLTLHLDPASLGLSARYGASWTERVHGLLQEYGPFQLAYFETLLRAADIRASQINEPDSRLEGDMS